MSKNKIIEKIETEQMGKEVPEFGPGDTVVVQVKIKKAIASDCRPSRESSSASVIAASILPYCS